MVQVSTNGIEKQSKEQLQIQYQKANIFFWRSSLQYWVSWYPFSPRMKELLHLLTFLQFLIFVPSFKKICAVKFQSLDFMSMKNFVISSKLSSSLGMMWPWGWTTCWTWEKHSLRDSNPFFACSPSCFPKIWRDGVSNFFEKYLRLICLSLAVNPLAKMDNCLFD